MHDYTVPDSIGDPIRAWRTWYVVPEDKTSGELRLRSFVYARLWKIGEAVEATCNAERHTDSETPSSNCTCGLYAVTGKDALDPYYRDRYSTSGSWTEIWRVCGEVALWGKLIPAERGYRAQYAYPVSIEIPKRIRGREQFLSPNEIAIALAHYGCEVKINEDVLDLRTDWNR